MEGGTKGNSHILSVYSVSAVRYPDKSMQKFTGGRPSPLQSQIRLTLSVSNPIFPQVILFLLRLLSSTTIYATVLLLSISSGSRLTLTHHFFIGPTFIRPKEFIPSTSPRKHFERIQTAGPTKELIAKTSLSPPPSASR